MKVPAYRPSISHAIVTFTRNNTTFFVGCSFILRASQALLVLIRYLSSGCVMLHYILNDLIFFSVNSYRNYENSFFVPKSYISYNTDPNNVHCNPGKQIIITCPATQSLTHSHTHTFIRAYFV